MKTALKKSIFALILTVLLSLNAAYGQDTKGTDFWLAFPGNLGTGNLTLFITSDVNTSGNVDIPGIAFSTPFSVTANTVTSVSIPSAAEIQTSDIVGNQGIHVTSLQEVSVYGLNRIVFTTDAFQGLPTDILGTDHVVISHQTFNSQLAVVGTVNGTTVTITPTVAVGIHPAGVPFNIALNLGQTYQLRTGTSGPDLTGTTITSNNPVGVFGGNQCANLPSASFCCCDYIVEMIPPTTTFGKNFLTVPLATRLNGDTWRILASENGTNVTINGAAQPVINRGQFINVILSAQSIISSDKPVLVTQYSHSTDYDGITSDPFMMLVPPFEQFLAAYTVTTPATGFSQNFVNLVAPNAVVGSLQLDGIPVPAVNFTPIGASGYSGAKVPLTLGSHNLQASLPFGCFVYGFDSFDSYGYPGGGSLAPIAIVTSLDVTPEFAINDINTQHCVDGLVLDQNGDPVQGVRVDYLISGANAGAGFAFSDSMGVAQFCYTGTVAGVDTIIGTTGTLSDTVIKVWDNPLPVELSSFTSTVTGRNVVLNWSTAEEINNSGFDIERSAENTSWTKIGFVNGNGTTNESKDYTFRDQSLNTGKYNYRLKQIDFNGNYEYFNLSNEIIVGVPEVYSLSQNYPNPFNPSTKIDFQIPQDGNVKITVFDNSGKQLATLVNEVKTAGYYSVSFNASNLSSGVYFYKIEAGSFSKTLKMSLIK